MDLHVIIPSLGNPCGVIATLQGLISLESDKQSITYSVVADEGDVDTIHAVEMLARKRIDESESVVECSVKDLDANLNRFINVLADDEDGELTMVLCDDVLPLTPGWDYLAAMIKSPLFAWKELNNPMSFTYPCVQKVWRQLTGYVLCDRFPFWFADAWHAEVFQMTMDCPVPIIDSLVLGGRRGKTRGFRDLPFWLDYWIATRKVRIAEAEKIKGNEIDHSMLDAFKTIDQIHRTNMQQYNRWHQPPESPPSQRYLDAHREALEWLADNPEDRPVETLGYAQMNQFDMEVLESLVESVKGGKFLEHGSWVGESTRVIARIAKQRGGSVTITDNWHGNYGIVLEDLARNHDVKGIFERNMEGLPINYLVEGSYDFVFVDADHRYSQVSEDIKRFLPMVREGGILAGHDFDATEYDNAYIEHDYVNGVHHGVIKAVIEAFGERIHYQGSIWWITV
jgi:predicted O-methyltransferase YrrM